MPALTSHQEWCYRSRWVLTGCCQKHCSNQTDYQVLSCSLKTSSFIKTHTFTNTHRVTNSANVRWCIKSSAGLAMPLRPGLCCQCKSRFRNLQAPVEHPNSLCSGVVSCKFLHHHPGAQTVCAEGRQGINAIFTPQSSGARPGAVRCAAALRRATAAAGWSSRSPRSPQGPHRPLAALPGWPAAPRDLRGSQAQFIFFWEKISHQNFLTKQNYISNHKQVKIS